MTTAQATWGKEKPKAPVLKQNKQIEQTEEDMIMNLRLIKAKNH